MVGVSCSLAKGNQRVGSLRLRPLKALPLREAPSACFRPAYVLASVRLPSGAEASQRSRSFRASAHQPSTTGDRPASARPSYHPRARSNGGPTKEASRCPRKHDIDETEPLALPTAETPVINARAYRGRAPSAKERAGLFRTMLQDSLDRGLSKYEPNNGARLPCPRRCDRKSSTGVYGFLADGEPRRELRAASYAAAHV